MLLHGFGATSFTWRSVVDRFSVSHRVVTFDRLGFGGSDAPARGTWTDGRNPYTLDASVRSTLAVLDAAGIGAAVLVGSSAGGTVAIATAAAAPERVEALVLADTPLAEGPPRAVAAAFAVPGVRHVAPVLLRAGRRFAERGLRMAWHDPDAITPDVVDGYRAAWERPGWEHALVEMTLATAPFDLATAAATITVPTLVVAGEHDRIVPRADTRALSSSFRFGRVAFVPAAGHLPHEEQPEAFLWVVEPFLASLPRG